MYSLIKKINFVSDYGVTQNRNAGVDYYTNKNGYIYFQGFFQGQSGWRESRVYVNGKEIILASNTDYGTYQVFMPIPANVTYKVTTDNHQYFECSSIL